LAGRDAIQAEPANVRAAKITVTTRHEEEDDKREDPLAE